MTVGLRRWQKEGHDHFVTFSCHKRRPYLASDQAKVIYLQHLEKIRARYSLRIFGYVLMPEHVHLLISEPAETTLASVLRVLKTQTLRSLKGSLDQFWEKRYYDFNVFSWEKRIEKVKYMHRNPVTRGLTSAPDEYRWSSFRHYLTGKSSPLLLDTNWVAGWQRQRAHVSRWSCDEWGTWVFA